ncbi:MAG TPA: M3 family oligoendopeptidase [Chloroflexota bacterium]|nr:M3 family oligoendopeptidase [Chloroflexota bacterium]
MTTYVPNDYQQKAWRTDDLFPDIDSPEIEATLAQLRSDLDSFAAWQPKLGPELSVAEFRAILDALEKITRQIYRLFGYSAMRFCADTQDQKAQNFFGQFRQMEAESQNRWLFFELWWKNLAEETAVPLLKAAPDYRYWLESLRRQKPHTLTEPEEQIINLKNVNGRLAFGQLYESIINRYTFQLQVEGEEKSLTREDLTTYFRSPDPDLRETAYREFCRVFGHDAPILGQIYQAITRDWHSEFVGARRFASPIAARNLINDIPDSVVETLLAVVQANAPLFQRYFRLKARRLGLDKLRRCDLYAPTGQSRQTYSFTAAVSLALSSFHAFHPRLAQLAHRVFDEDHYDSELRPGKQGTGRCIFVTPELTPWILHSYHGQPYEIATMAHELGHAIHCMLAAHHNILHWLSSLPLAETASTFAELLLIDHLLAQNPDPDVRQMLLFKQLDGAYATIMRQGWFALFEQAAHDAIRDGATVATLDDLYLENLHEQFGTAVETPDDFRYEWVAISHFFSMPFYVYAYAFGQLLAFALYEQYQREGERFKERYLALLAAGGSAAPMALLAQVGVDVTDANFWQGGFDVLARLVVQLEGVAATAVQP